MKQKNNLRLVYKIHTKQLKKAKWDLTLPLSQAMEEQPDIVVSLNSSQCLRFIDELNGDYNIDIKINHVKSQISKFKKMEYSIKNTNEIKNLYNKRYELQFVKDYVCIIMDSEKDYDRANEGFKINGIKFRRFLGTNGGIKNSTIVYVNELLYPELKKRLDNGRDMTKKIVPAKLEAYQALICSGSTPIPEPNGIIVVKDCITHFKDNVITIRDSENEDDEPILEYVDNYEIEHNNSDGFGLMLPRYSKRINGYLNNDFENTISGMNSRFPFTKGMIYTFDFVEFAEKIANTYEVVDAWGDKRDIRDCEVILTTSMLKLWDSYKNWEDYITKCRENHYQLSTPKITPDKLENVRLTNYQFLQPYELSDEEIYELCKPTIDEIKDVLGMDYRKAICLLAGFGLNSRNIFDIEENYVKALMIEPKMINEPFIRKKIYENIKGTIDRAKKGSIKISGNYAMIGGDPYALCQSIFGMEITGLLKRGEIYHKYWSDKGSTEVCCFRAPMTCANNIRKMKLNNSEECKHWFKYITTVELLNAWDTTCDAMNGADFDGDTNMCTDNPILLRNTKELRTIMCMQRSATKTVPTEEDIIASNKLAFNDDIGVITNHVTSMIEKQAMFDKYSEEYKTLEYRIMCGQHYQQSSIDRAKGIISKPMPKYWYDKKEAEIRGGIDNEIVAPNKPYFMIYVYNDLKRENEKYNKDCNRKVSLNFYKYNFNCVEDIYRFEPKTNEMIEFLNWYERKKNVGENKCTVNKICYLFEKEFKDFKTIKENLDEFDISLIKSDLNYSSSIVKKVGKVLKEYYYDVVRQISNYNKNVDNIRRVSKDDVYAGVIRKKQFIEYYQAKTFSICNNEDTIISVIIDNFYFKGKKRFMWELCGEQIVLNLLNRNDNKVCFPSLGGDDFEYYGEFFKMNETEIEEW